MKNNKGFTVIEGLLILVIVGIIGGTGWDVWNARSKSNEALDKTSQSSRSTATSPIKQNAVSVPTFNKLPSGWKEYKNNDIGFRFGYPEEWGSLTANEVQGNSIVSLKSKSLKDDSKNLDGYFYFLVEKTDGFGVNTSKYGATVKPTKTNDEISWTVTAENPANADNHAVGDKFDVKTQVINGGVAYEFPGGDEGCTYSRWAVELKAGYAVIALPQLCGLGYLGASVPDANQKSYSQLSTDILNTFTVY